MGHTGDGEGQGVVAPGGAPLPDDQAHADSHEGAARQGGQQGPAGEVGQHVGKLLPQLVEQGHAAGGQDRDLQELTAQALEGQQVAQRIQQGRQQGRRQAEPVVEQQHQAHDAPLGDAHLLVDVVDAEGGDGRPQHNAKDLLPGEPLRQLPDGAREYLGYQIKTSSYNKFES